MTCGDEVVHDLDVRGVVEVDAVGVGAVGRRDHPEEIGLHVGAPREHEVELRPVLQRQALHAHSPAFLEVQRLRNACSEYQGDRRRNITSTSPGKRRHSGAEHSPLDGDRSSTAARTQECSKWKDRAR